MSGITICLDKTDSEGTWHRQCTTSGESGKQFKIHVEILEKIKINIMVSMDESEGTQHNISKIISVS